MAIEYSFKGEKGRRKVVKTIDIHEESYQALRKMILSGENMSEDIVGPLVEDTYSIFGGNSYGGIVSMAVNILIMDILEKLNERGMLSVDMDDANDKILEAVFPCMCFTKGDEESAYMELRFFDTDSDEVMSEVTGCLKEIHATAFSECFKKAIMKDSRPAGEIALGILMFICSNVVTTDKNAN